MPCPACSELPTLRELRTPRTQTGKFMRGDLSSEDFKLKSGNQLTCSVTPKALVKAMIFNENNGII
jgi:hypothetical protein